MHLEDFEDRPLIILLQAEVAEHMRHFLFSLNVDLDGLGANVECNLEEDVKFLLHRLILHFFDFFEQGKVLGFGTRTQQHKIRRLEQLRTVLHKQLVQPLLRLEKFLDVFDLLLIEFQNAIHFRLFSLKFIYILIQFQPFMA